MTDPAAYCSSQDVLNRLVGTPIDMSGAFRGALVAKIPEVCAEIDRRVRMGRGQRAGWSFLAASPNEVQLVSFAGTATAGDFVLALGTDQTGSIAFDADDTGVQSALDAALGAGVVAVAPAIAGGPFLLTFAAAGPQLLFAALPALTPTSTYLVVERLVPGAVVPVVRRYTAVRGGSAYLSIDDAVEVSQVRLLGPGGMTTRTLALEADYLTNPIDALPIVGLELVRGVWPWNVGGVEVTLIPGYATSVPYDVRVGAIVEVIRSYYADRAGNDDRIGMTPFGQLVTSRAFTSKVAQLVSDYRRGDAFLRPIG